MELMINLPAPPNEAHFDLSIRVVKVRVTLYPLIPNVDIWISSRGDGKKRKIYLLLDWRAPSHRDVTEASNQGSIRKIRSTTIFSGGTRGDRSRIDLARGTNKSYCCNSFVIPQVECTCERYYTQNNSDMAEIHAELNENGQLQAIFP